MLAKSNDKKWMKCPGSVEAEEGLEKTLDGNEKAEIEVLKLVGKYFDGEYIDKEPSKYLERANSVIQYVRKFHSKSVGIFKTKVVLSIETKLLGLVNYICVSSDEHIEIIIYSNKYINEQLLDNVQLLTALIYEIDISENDFKTMALTVVQPNCQNSFISQPIEINQLTEKSDNIVSKLNLIRPFCQRVPGDYCDKCLAKGNCPELNHNNKSIVIQHELIVVKVHDNLKTMSEAELGAILDAEEVFNDAFEKAKIEAAERISNGLVVNGWHNAPGNKKSVWNEEEEIVAKKLKSMKVLKDTIYPSKLISPAQARKLEKLTDTQRKNLEKLITEVEGKSKLKKNDFQQVSFM